MDILTPIIGYLLPESKSFTSKATFSIIILAGLFLLNEYTGFIFNYKMDKKIAQLESLNRIISDKNVDSAGRIYAVFLRDRVITRQPFYLPLFSKPQIIYTVDSTVVNGNIDIRHLNPTIISSIPMGEKYYFLISSSGIFILFAFAAFVITFIDTKADFYRKLASALVVFSLIIIAAVGLFWVLSWIPKIDDSTWMYNYIINGIVQCGLMGLLYYRGRRSLKLKT